MFNFCGNFTIFELLLLWALVCPSEMQIKTFEKGVASIVNKNFGELRYSDCADALQVFFFLNSIYNFCFQNCSDLLLEKNVLEI